MRAFFPFGSLGFPGLVGALGALVLAVPASAQAVPLIAVGDALPGLGAVGKILNVAVNDTGDWIAEVQTAGGYAVVRNGAVILKQGDPLAPPAGAYGVVGHFQSVTLSSALESAFAIQGGSGGLFFGTTPLVLDHSLTSAPGFSPGAYYSRFYDVHLNDARQILASVSVDDSAVVGITDRAMMLLQTDAAGALLSEAAVVKEGQLLPGLSSQLREFPEAPRGFAINASGDILTQATLFDSTTAILLNQSVVAVQGGLSPVFGSSMGHLYDRVDLGDGGDYAYFGSYAGGIGLVWNGIEVVHTGDSLPAIAPYLLESFSTRPVSVDAQGRVVWFGDWDDPDTTRDTGIFRDHALVLKEGVSLAAGQVIDELDYAIELSDNGRYLAFGAYLVGGGYGVFRLDLEGGITPFAGCVPNAGVLTVTGTSSLGKSLSLKMENGQGDGVLGFVAVATAQASGFPPCGISVPGLGELLIQAPVLIQSLSPWSTGFPFSFGSLEIPNQPALLGAEVFLQGAFLDLIGIAPSEPVRLSDGVSVKLGL